MEVHIPTAILQGQQNIEYGQWWTMLIIINIKQWLHHKDAKEVHTKKHKNRRRAIIYVKSCNAKKTWTSYGS